LPYCRVCGAKLEENAHFCHKCGTPVFTFAPAPPLAKPKEKNPLLVPVIVLLVVVVVAVIVGAFVLWTIYANSNQANGSRTNGNELSLSFQSEMAKANVMAQNLIGKTVLNGSSAAGLQYTDLHQAPGKKLSVNVLSASSPDLAYKKWFL